MESKFIIKLFSIFVLFVYLFIQISSCGTPVKKSATRKKIHTNERHSETIVKKKRVKTASHKAGTNSRLIFASNRTGNLEIWTSEIDGSNPIQLTDNNKYESWWPRVSPDKTKVLFYRSPKGTDENSYEQTSLWRINIDGKNETVLIPNGSYGWHTQGVADWSPDGTKIVMATSSKNSFWHLYITDSSGKNPVRVSRRDSLYLDPSWSPDGTNLVYSAFPNDYSGSKLNHLEIFTSNLDGSSEKRLTFDEHRDHDPNWSPDGQWITFETEVMPLYWLLGKWALRIIPAKGGETIELLNDGHINTLPRWSPDSLQLYFHRLRFREDKKFGLWRINRDGTNLIQISGSKSYKDIQADVY